MSSWMERLRKFHSRYGLVVAGVVATCFVAVPLVWVFLYRQALYPGGSYSGFVEHFGSFAFLFLSYGMIGCFVLAALFRGKVALVLLAGCVAGVIASIWSFGQIRDIRHDAFDAMALRSRPLVEALRRYEVDYQMPASRLKDIVPKYLDEVPGTGMPRYPEFYYMAGERMVGEVGENQWMLSVSTGFGFMGFDQFIYLPNGEYPVDGWGGRIERIRDWGYVHE